MIEKKRIIGILTDLEGINEDLLNLYEDLRQEGDPHDVAARRENLRLLGEYNDKLEAFETASETLRALIQRITHVEAPREVQPSTPLDAATNTRVSQQLDHQRPHALDEHFTFTKPVGFKLAGQAHADTDAWTQLHHAVLGQLASMDPERFQRLPEDEEISRNKGSKFTRSAQDFRKPLALPQGLYCEGHLSAQTIRDNIRDLLAYFAISESQMVVYLSKDRDAE
jgi:hypothetical protein